MSRRPAPPSKTIQAPGDEPTFGQVAAILRMASPRRGAALCNPGSHEIRSGFRSVPGARSTAPEGGNGSFGWRDEATGGATRDLFRRGRDAGATRAPAAGRVPQAVARQPDVTGPGRSGWPVRWTRRRWGHETDLPEHPLGASFRVGDNRIGSPADLGHFLRTRSTVTLELRVASTRRLETFPSPLHLVVFLVFYRRPNSSSRRNLNASICAPGAFRLQPEIIRLSRLVHAA